MDALEFLSEAHEELGIPEAPDLTAKPPIVLRQMKRVHLAMLFGALGYKKGAEIGVSRGQYSRCLWEHTGAAIYSIDPYEVYAEYLEEYTQEAMDQLYEEAKTALASTGCVILKKYSMEAVGEFWDESLDFVHIDGNHGFQHVTNDIAEWSKKVRPGGIVSGHDYVRYKRNPVCHVRSVVGAWAYAYKIKPWFVAAGKGGSSWFWVV